MLGQERLESYPQIRLHRTNKKKGKHFAGLSLADNNEQKIEETSNSESGAAPTQDEFDSHGAPASEGLYFYSLSATELREREEIQGKIDRLRTALNLSEDEHIEYVPPTAEYVPLGRAPRGRRL